MRVKFVDVKTEQGKKPPKSKKAEAITKRSF